MRYRRFAIVVAVIVAALAALWSASWFSKRDAGPWLDETATVTVLDVSAGRVGKHGSYFDQRVRFENGHEHVLRFNELLPKGSRVWVSYRRSSTSGAISMKAYVPKGQ